MLRVAPRTDAPALNPMIAISIKKILPGEVLGQANSILCLPENGSAAVFFFFFLFYLDHLVAFELKRSNYFSSSSFCGVYDQ